MQQQQPPAPQPAQQQQPQQQQPQQQPARPVVPPAQQQMPLQGQRVQAIEALTGTKNSVKKVSDRLAEANDFLGGNNAVNGYAIGAYQTPQYAALNLPPQPQGQLNVVETAVQSVIKRLTAFETSAIHDIATLQKEGKNWADVKAKYDGQYDTVVDDAISKSAIGAWTGAGANAQQTAYVNSLKDVLSTQVKPKYLKALDDAAEFSAKVDAAQLAAFRMFMDMAAGHKTFGVGVIGTATEQLEELEQIGEAGIRERLQSAVATGGGFFVTTSKDAMGRVNGISLESSHKHHPGAFHPFSAVRDARMAALAMVAMYGKSGEPYVIAGGTHSERMEAMRVFRELGVKFELSARESNNFFPFLPIDSLKKRAEDRFYKNIAADQEKQNKIPQSLATTYLTQAAGEYDRAAEEQNELKTFVRNNVLNEAKLSSVAPNVQKLCTELKECCANGEVERAKICANLLAMTDVLVNDNATSPFKKVADRQQIFQMMQANLLNNNAAMEQLAAAHGRLANNDVFANGNFFVNPQNAQITHAANEFNAGDYGNVAADAAGIIPVNKVIERLAAFDPALRLNAQHTQAQAAQTTARIDANFNTANQTSLDKTTSDIARNITLPGAAVPRGQADFAEKIEETVSKAKGLGA